MKAIHIFDLTIIIIRVVIPIVLYLCDSLINVFILAKYFFEVI